MCVTGLAAPPVSYRECVTLNKTLPLCNPVSPLCNPSRVALAINTYVLYTNTHNREFVTWCTTGYIDIVFVPSYHRRRRHPVLYTVQLYVRLARSVHVRKWIDLYKLPELYKEYGITWNLICTGKRVNKKTVKWSQNLVNKEPSVLGFFVSLIIKIKYKTRNKIIGPPFSF